MKKFLIIALLSSASLAGCGRLNRAEAHWTGSAKVCVDGVQYLQFPSGASVQYDKNGHVVTCP